MNANIEETVRKMVYSSIKSEDIAKLASSRYGADYDSVFAQVKVMHADLLKWGISCPKERDCRQRRCAEDMQNNHVIRCSYPM